MLRRKMPAAAVIIAVMVMLTPDTALAQLYGNRLASKDGKWLLPVASLHLTSTEADHIRRGSVQAWDITAPKGTPIFPIADGVVEYAGCDNKGGYGCWTYIRHEGGIHTIMGHMIQGSIVVKAGQQVSQWDVVGQVGWTGMTSFGPHVHLEIHKPGGGRYDVGQFWDVSAMHYVKLGNAESNEVITEIGTVGAAVAPMKSEPAPAPHENESVTLLPVLLQMVKAMPTNTLGGVVIALFFMFVMLGQYRKFVFASLVCMVGMVSMFEVPVANIQAAGVNAPSVDSSEVWDKAYAFMRGWEGGPNPDCVSDPVWTWKGVTQGTYNAYRKRKGLPIQDVCRNMTEDEAKEIYYGQFWISSGASEIAKVNPGLAIAFFDFAVTAGEKSASPPAKILRECGGLECDVKTYNDLRAAWYKTRRTCNLYCAGWLRRVADIRNITEKQ